MSTLITRGKGFERAYTDDDGNFVKFRNDLTSMSVFGRKSIEFERSTLKRVGDKVSFEQ